MTDADPGPGFDIRYTPDEGQPRTVIFAPQNVDDADEGWLRAEFEWAPGAELWRQVGCEPVSNVALFDEEFEGVRPARAQFDDRTDPEAEETDD